MGLWPVSRLGSIHGRVTEPGSVAGNLPSPKETGEPLFSTQVCMELDREAVFKARGIDQIASRPGG